MSNRSAYRHRVARVFAAVLGLAVLPQAPAAAAIDKADLQKLSVSEKLAAIREATSIAFDRARAESGGSTEAIEKKLMAQWYNWGNWRNWANWANWASYWNNY